MASSRASGVFARQLRRYRRSKGFTQEQLAAALAEADPPNALRGVTIAKIEAGSRAVKIDEAVALAVVLDVPLPLLLVPLETGEDVELTLDTTADAYRVFEWMSTAVPLPGRESAGTMQGLTLGFAVVHAYRDVTAAEKVAGKETQPIRNLLGSQSLELYWGAPPTTDFRPWLPPGSADLVEETKQAAAPSLHALADAVEGFARLGGRTDGLVIDPIILGLMAELGINRKGS